VKIRRLPIRLAGDDRRVIVRPFILTAARATSILQRIAQLNEDAAASLLEKVRHDFEPRHRRIDVVFDEHYRMAIALTGWKDEWSLTRRLLAGAYFTMEYSVDYSAAMLQTKPGVQ
jgi:hypothetical protein